MKFYLWKIMEFLENINLLLKHYLISTNTLASLLIFLPTTEFPTWLKVMILRLWLEF